jgi:ParB family chromosome partitioning protein
MSDLLNPPAIVRTVEARVTDVQLVEEARAAREEAEAGETAVSPARWREADRYAELSRRGWGVRKIAEACDTNKDTVSVMVRMVSTYVDKDARPIFWTAYQATRADTKAVHVSQNTGEPEWYTPPDYLDAARAVLGAIDLDPASSEIAQRTVRAEKYFTKDDDGLQQHWQGRVWLNPPYNPKLVDRFVAKLCEHFGAGDVSAAVLLVNNATDTQWFHQAAAVCSALCLTLGRVKFLDDDGNPGAPLQGQALLYFGGEVEAFGTAFGRFGFWVPARRPKP